MAESLPNKPELPMIGPPDLDSWSRLDLQNLIVWDAEKIQQGLDDDEPGLVFTHIPQEDSWEGYVIAFRPPSNDNECAPTISLTKISRINRPYKIVEQKELYINLYLNTGWDYDQFGREFNDDELRAIATVLNNDAEQRPQATDKDLLQPYWNGYFDYANTNPRIVEKKSAVFDLIEDETDFINNKTAALASELLRKKGSKDEYGSCVTIWLNIGGLHYIAEVCGNESSIVEAIHFGACLDEGQPLDQVALLFDGGKKVLSEKPTRPIIWNREILEDLFKNGEGITRESAEPILYD